MTVLKKFRIVIERLLRNGWVRRSAYFMLNKAASKDVSAGARAA